MVHKILQQQHRTIGFTLVEVLIVLGLVAFVAAFGFVISIGSFQRYLFFSERDLVLDVLQKARSQAMHNVGETTHGVRVEEDAYVLFSGEGMEFLFKRSPFVQVDPNDAEVVFAQLSGDASGDLLMVLSRDAQTAEFHIGENGSIDWLYE